MRKFYTSTDQEFYILTASLDSHAANCIIGIYRVMLNLPFIILSIHYVIQFSCQKRMYRVEDSKFSNFYNCIICTCEPSNTLSTSFRKYLAAIVFQLQNYNDTFQKHFATQTIKPTISFSIEEFVRTFRPIFFSIFIFNQMEIGVKSIDVKLQAYVVGSGGGCSQLNRFL